MLQAVSGNNNWGEAEGSSTFGFFSGLLLKHLVSYIWLVEAAGSGSIQGSHFLKNLCYLRVNSRFRQKQLREKSRDKPLPLPRSLPESGPNHRSFWGTFPKIALKQSSLQSDTYVGRRIIPTDFSCGHGRNRTAVKDFAGLCLASQPHDLFFLLYLWVAAPHFSCLDRPLAYASGRSNYLDTLNLYRCSRQIENFCMRPPNFFFQNFRFIFSSY